MEDSNIQVNAIFDELDFTIFLSFAVNFTTISWDMYHDSIAWHSDWTPGHDSAIAETHINVHLGYQLLSD